MDEEDDASSTAFEACSYRQRDHALSAIIPGHEGLLHDDSDRQVNASDRQENYWDAKTDLDRMHQMNTNSVVHQHDNVSDADERDHIQMAQTLMGFATNKKENNDEQSEGEEKTIHISVNMMSSLI
eukprot:119627_1